MFGEHLWSLEQWLGTTAPTSKTGGTVDQINIKCAKYTNFHQKNQKKKLEQTSHKLLKVFFLLVF